MGVVCLCGVRVGLDGVAAVRMNQEVTFAAEMGGTRRGTLTYTADVCSQDLATSFVTITFLQTSNETPNRSFTETSTSITSVVCNQEGVNCEITVIGTMNVNGVNRTSLLCSVILITQWLWTMFKVLLLQDSSVNRAHHQYQEVRL